jgi:hypothetical protein
MGLRDVVLEPASGMNEFADFGRGHVAAERDGDGGRAGSATHA